METKFGPIITVDDGAANAHSLYKNWPVAKFNRGYLPLACLKLHHNQKHSFINNIHF
jgi:hypothetical protein